MKRTIRIILAVLGSALVILLVGFLIRTQFYYKAIPDIVTSTMNNPELTITENDKTITISPSSGTSTTTFIFYPGAKVDAHAYIAKLGTLSLEHNLTIVISKPPLHLQIFAINAAQDITGNNIIIGGHSLGGSMACEYTKNHPDTVSGMILMGAYCNSDISSLSGVQTLIIAAGNDGVLPLDTISSYHHNLPSDALFSIITGATHAQFGNYGLQDGDGISTISDDDVRTQISTQVGVLLDRLQSSP